MTIVDTLNEMWTGLLEIMTQFVIPDWNAIIGLLPILIFLGIVGPLLTLLPLGIVIYQLRKPRVKGVALRGRPDRRGRSARTVSRSSSQDCPIAGAMD